MDNNSVMEVLDDVMREHYAVWVINGEPNIVICSCMERVDYLRHIKEQINNRAQAEKSKK